MRTAVTQIPPAPSLENIARDRLFAVLTALAILHFVAAVVSVPHLQSLPFVFSSPASNPLLPGLSAPLLALATAAFLLVVRLLFPRLPLRWADPLAALVAVLVVINCLASIAATNALDKTTLAALVLACSGFFLFSSRWLVLVAFISLGAWGLLACLGFPSAQIWFHGCMMLLGAVLAFVVQRMQRRTLRHILTGLQSKPPAAANVPPPDAEAEEKFRRWYEATFEGIAIHEKGLIIEANPMLGKMLQCKSEELQGRSLLDWFTLTSRSLVEDSILLGNYRPFEAVIRLPDKTEVPFELFSKELPYQGRRVMVTAFRDVSERQRAAAALTVEQQRLERQFRRQTAIAEIEFNIDQVGELAGVLEHIAQAVVEHLPAEAGACLLLHQHGEFTLGAAAGLLPRITQAGFNPVAQLSGVGEWIVENRESFVASNVTHEDPFQVNDPVPFIGAYVAHPLSEHGRVIGVLIALQPQPHQFKPDDLDYLTTLASRAAVVIAKIRLYEELRQANSLLEEQSAVLVVQNTELTQAKEAAEAASRAQAAFLASVSHELRTPLNGVLGMTNILRNTELNHEQGECLAAIETSAESLLGLINRILDFVAVESRTSPGHATTFNLREMVSKTVGSFSERHQDKPLTFRTDLGAELPCEVRGNPDAVQQVLSNLLDNAVKFTEHGDIAVEAAPHGDENGHVTIQFNVRDSGIGIPPQAQKRLFQSFSQIDASIGRRYSGLGLGLAISKQLIDRMGGKIGVESTLGKGSTFWFTVPFQRA